MNEVSAESIVGVQFINGQALIEYLTQQKRLDLLSDAENNFRKVLLLSIASYFEKEITAIVLTCAKIHSNDNALIGGLIKSKAVDRQYFTYFSWDDGKNANTFFALFGPDFKERMQEKVKNDPTLGSSIRSFLQLGRDRNCLVHRNFAEYPIESNADDIHKLYKEALYFINILRDELTPSNETLRSPGE